MKYSNFSCRFTNDIFFKVGPKSSQVYNHDSKGDNLNLTRDAAMKGDHEIDDPILVPKIISDPTSDDVFQSLHLKLNSFSSSQTSSAKNNIKSGVDDTNANIDEDLNKDKAEKKITLQTYRYGTIVLHSLGISKQKFGEWIAYTLQHENEEDRDDLSIKSASANSKIESSLYVPNITSEEIYVNCTSVRSHLRRAWFDGNLISSRTEIFATYPSDRTLSEEEKGLRVTKNHKSSEKFIGKHILDQQRTIRGGFDDLLNVYAERLAGIVGDEVKDFEQTPNTSPKSINNPNLTNEWTTVKSWLSQSYGQENTRRLEYSNLSLQKEQTQLDEMQKFLDWFKYQFPYYYDECEFCNASYRADSEKRNKLNQSKENISENDEDKEFEDIEDDDKGSFLGYVYPRQSELVGGASRTELYRCHICGHFTRFPRFNVASSVVGHGRGRCGEYSALLFRILRGLGHTARWVVDWSDHVWVECLICDFSADASENRKCSSTFGGRFVHLDPCEAAVDKPFLYQEWGKRQTYIIAFSAPPIKYNKNHLESKVISSSKSAKQDNEKSGKMKVPIVNSDSKSNEMKIYDNQKETDHNFRLIEDVTSYYTSDSFEQIQKRRKEEDPMIKSSLEKAEERLENLLIEINSNKGNFSL
eukprot:CAMPEP_0184866084 /NCGR_PEP_ID=MMETSP0580-20130426/20739_1 /TAXON_ID=1118495 /ORGANISM="Dactyliosolen fragilissimus" /LENGTH=641 /DNA_ID=CAMNT_0027365561 /DNA_START=189 /DNA_END=2114 /DNA_ORIENTATION=-